MKLRNLTLSSATMLLIIAVSCTQTEQEPLSPERDYVVNVRSESVIPGVMAVKLKEEPSSTDEVFEMFSGLPVTNIQRMFVGPEKFEGRKRAMGLTKWYMVSYDESMTLTRAMVDIGAVPGVEIAEFMPKSYRNDDSVYPFNDPDFSSQWHYYNDGSGSYAEAGSDINLLPAWEVTTGDRDVIVAIIDGGIDYDHEDLADNMWINEAELNGSTGVDDDGNGYVDDIYGFNFCIANGNTPIGAVTANDHGTHVAGTVAAVNNNGVGVAGIAGGDGSGNGVRLMSCQTSDNEGHDAFIAASFQYAADNGAVIAQCSWGVDENYTAVEEAIDYFNKCAGMDENGNQIGPMAGGVVIFAAGNSSSSRTDVYPANLESVIAVSSIGADYEAAYYTNYGDWVDVSAPGGDAQKNREVLSTIPDNQYGTMQGTSMACPHVSGVAALVVSASKEQGFTADHLRTILVKGTNDIIYDYNPNYEGMLGSGLIDAGKCVKMYTPEPPEAVTDFKLWHSGNVVSAAIQVPKDPDSGKPEILRLFYSKEDLSELDPDNLPETVDYVDAEIGVSMVGEYVECSTPFLEYNTTYYFRVMAIDLMGSCSTLSKQQTEAIGDNNIPPVIEANGEKTMVVAKHEVKTLDFSVSDPEKNPVTCSLSSDASELSLVQKNDSTWTLSVIGSNAPVSESEETYDVDVIVSDGYLSSSVNIQYTILPNHAPVLVSEIPDIFLNGAGSTEIDLSPYFSDPDEGDPLTLRVSSQNASLRASISGKILNINATEPVADTLTVEAVDYNGAVISTTVGVLVRDASIAVDVYPNPVTDILNIRTGYESQVTVTIRSTDGSVVFSNENEEMAQVSPFAPYSIDLSRVSGGVYNVKIMYKSESGTVLEYSTQIVKL